MSERPGENKRDMPAGPQNTGGLQRSWDNPEQEPVVVVYVYQSVAISLGVMGPKCAAFTFVKNLESLALFCKRARNVQELVSI